MAAALMCLSTTAPSSRPVSGRSMKVSAWSSTPHKARKGPRRTTYAPSSSGRRLTKRRPPFGAPSHPDATDHRNAFGTYTQAELAELFGVGRSTIAPREDLEGLVECRHGRAQSWVSVLGVDRHLTARTPEDPLRTAVGRCLDRLLVSRQHAVVSGLAYDHPRPAV